MDERRFRAVLTEIDMTIRDFDEETILAAFGVIADKLGYEFVKRDPGPECEYCDWWDREGLITPIHACPHDAPDADEQTFVRAFVTHPAGLHD